MVHHLQKDVVDIRMRLFDLVEQRDTMRVLIDTVCQLTTLVETDIARGRPDQAADGVLFHVFRHVEAQQLNAQRVGQLLGHFGFANARGPGEEIVADGLFRLTQSGPGQLDRRGQGVDCGILPEDNALERSFEILEHLSIVLADVFGRDACDLGDNRLDLFRAERLAALGFCNQMLRGPGFVDHVDGRVGQLAVIDVPRGQLNGGLDRVGGVFDAVVRLEIRLEAFEDLDASSTVGSFTSIFWNRRLSARSFSKC